MKWKHYFTTYDVTTASLQKVASNSEYCSFYILFVL